MNDVIHVSETDSTNSHLRRLADSRGVESYTALMADYQTAGRGQVGNNWESQPGCNLLMSVVMVKPKVQLAQHFYASMAVSLAVCDVVEPLLDGPLAASLRVKWPNDIYVGDSKLAGLLIENRLAGHDIADSIVGLGLNVNQRRFLSAAPNPTSLVLLTGRENDVSEIASCLVTSLRLRMSQVEDGRLQAVHAAYMQRLYRMDGRLHRFSDAGGIFDASISSVLPDGQLVLVDANGVRRQYHFKEVEYVL